MAKPFDGFTDEQADAIHQSIKPYLKPDIRWDLLLDEITDDIGPVCKHAQALYTGDIQRRLKTMETALEAVLSAYDQSGGPLQWHIQRQVFDYLPRLDEETGPTLPGIMNAALGAVRQAKRRPFDHPHASAQERGAPKNHTIHLLVGHLLHVFDRVTGIIPTVYSSQHAEGGHKGTAYPFVFACLAPLNLIHHKQLSSAILAAYRQAKPGILAMKKDWADQLNALNHGSKPPERFKK